jgi:hypothetical protein
MANVLVSEERIRDILGIEAEIAPKELPLQTRLDANLSRLHELENVSRLRKQTLGSVKRK